MYLSIHHINQLIPRPVAGDVKSGDFAPEIAFKLAFHAKHEFTDPGMESVCSNDEIKLTLQSTFERDADGSFILFNVRNAVAKYGFDRLFDLAENGGPATRLNPRGVN